MVITTKKSSITRKFILSKLTPYDIYRYEFGEFTVGRPVVNHLRGEHRASMTIYLGQNGKLNHYDQGDDYYRGDCFDIVCQKYRITLQQALEHIAKTFMLVEGEPEAYKVITSQYIQPVMDPKRYSLIQCTTKKFTPRELNGGYWGKYKVIGEEKLRKHNVYSMKEVFLNRKKIPINNNEMVFGYWYPQGWKIMFPERSSEQKWISNIPLDTPEGLENIDKDHNTLVIKSKKCLMVMEEIYQYTCSMQNESLGSVSDKTGQYINENSRKVFYGGDSDIAGKKASYKITGKFHWSHINVPDIYLPKKDWSDWATITDTLEPIKQHLQIKGVIE